MSLPARSTPRPLPASLAPFVGRQAELRSLHALLQDPAVRLVTILGVGGAGKTRLALELAARLQPHRRHGAAFISLAQLESRDELLPALADALGVRLPPGGDLQQALQAHLAGQELLLVLDGFDLLLEEAVLLPELLAAAPRLQLLVTSRQKLGLEGETLLHLPGLDWPGPESDRPLESYDAVRLFLQKARQARPGFGLAAENAAAVGRICRQVGGLPLGILLAAAWVEHFSPTEIADQISAGLDFLAGVRRDAPPQHAAMRLVFDSSYERLDAPAQAVFRRLSVLRGSFSLEAAGAVAGVEADLSALIALADKSMLWRDPASARFELHTLLRQYGAEKLAAAGESQPAQARQAAFFSNFARRQAALLMSPAQPAALDAIQAEFDNLRQAWGFLVQQRDFATLGSLAPPLYAFCDMRSRFYEGEALFRQASQGLAPRPGESPQPLWGLMLLSWYDLRAYIEPWEEFTEMLSQARACLEQATRLQDQLSIAACRVLLGAIAERQGNYPAAIRHYQAGMQAHPPLDDFYWVEMRIGLSRQASRQYRQALQAFRRSLRRGLEAGESVKTGWARLNLGDTLLLLENPQAAAAELEQANALFEAVGNTLGCLCARYRLGRLALAQGDRASARAFAGQALHLAQGMHSDTWISKAQALLEQIDPPPAPLVRGASTAAAAPLPEPFSQRELEVLGLLKSACSGPEIAAELVVSLNTVRYHTKNIYRKLGVGSRLEAIRRAEECGL